ncbi:MULTISPECIES: DUF2911 domain-containing protein [unclassified Mucilaginibacter]|uniref:DUF2911 domain-containing protein n=1 Tax=unclassified Mucilaginibacter TaxID=2617802 RepID=UPI002AC93DA8|nr:MULTISPECIES: DUF2911 domain-containing protein [unclassified Mucilaginibacter]MEB0263785.1 DUF2911 domain-containing protein [Mucilaginibacter sp. 10I4]MEB0280230.1 DUF2911 domain-containing protein [Mucilaginibacter sp. 10B2]MEB0301147.1 DUF2911 domain-containing protein [Mucilaginibacter sp. 5C4]WPX24361.1 DUF2911 domain-containing protein [Mucilaginibacter sp. 5C4]
MKKTVIYLFTMLMACVTLNTYAQQEPRIPEASSTQTIIQDFGLGKITITYSRPNVKSRKIFGGINPYGQVWRTGANWATTITFSENVLVEGNKVPAGTYSLFSIPEKNSWTIILNKTVKQWGAYSYKQDADLVRFNVKPIDVKEKRETFTMAFANSTTKTSDLYIIWDHTGVPIRMQTDDDVQITANIDKLMQGDIKKRPYFNAIQYYYENDKDLKKAMQWALEAEKLEPKAPWFKLWKARVQLKMGNKNAAITTAQEGIKLAKESDDDEYVRLNEAVISQAKD